MKFAVINNQISVLKRQPKEDSENIDEVLFGMNVEILRKTSNNWFYIKTNYRYEGYVKGKGLIIDDRRSKQWEKEKNTIIISSFADVLNKPETSGYPIISLTRGANLLITDEISENNKFIKVKLPDSRTGWVRRNFISNLKKNYDIKDEINLRDNLAEAALSYLGVQYRWGGKTPLGIDCSGLCSMAYLLNGIFIYRDADIKEEFPIKEITFDKLKKGDLIFFPGHVALYLGKNHYIHASTSNDFVKINSLDEKDSNYNENLGKSPKKFGSIF